MKIKRLFATAAFAAAIGSGAFAHAARLGHPGYSAKGATAALTQWNIIADPVNAVSGSTSVIYPRLVAGLSEVDAEPGFELTEINIVLQSPVNYTDFTYSTGTLPADTTTWSPTPMDLQDPNDNPVDTAIQPGYLQVFWEATGGATTSDETGHVNDFEVLFNNLTTDPSEQATFTVYADPGTGGGGQFATPDSYMDGEGNTYSASEINLADSQSGDNVVVDLPVGVPEPSSLALLGVSTAGVLLQRRPRRQLSV